MRRFTLSAAPAAHASGALLAMVLAGTPTLAQPITEPGLPLREVVLFSTGVGYFGRNGQVSGAQPVDLHFRPGQMSDVLKSLVLADPHGKVLPVTWSLGDSGQSRPAATDIAVGAAQTLGQLLRQFQGAEIQVVLPAGTVTGVLVSTSTRSTRVADKPVETEVASLLTPAGFVVVNLDDATTLKFSDPQLEARFRDSLTRTASRLTAATDDGLKTLSLHFGAGGSRAVQAGYLLETPAWKTSYRLVMGPGGNASLQGWAIVENASSEDWNAVRLNLVSGRPSSFIQDLYTPVYVVRPVVAPSVQGSPYPQTYESETEASRQPRDEGSEQKVTALENRDPAPPRLHLSTSLLARGGTANYIANNNGPQYAAAQAAAAPFAAAAANQSAIGQGASAPPEAQGSERGDLFAYAIDGPITLKSGHAAMVPIVGAPVKGEAVTIVASSTASNELGPLAASNGFRLCNTTGEHLQGGPITVYAGGIYAGDALVRDIVPGEVRLISYATDLEVAARLDAVNETQKTIGISAVRGWLLVKTRTVKTRIFLLRNKSSKPKTVVLQLPDEPGYRLAIPSQSFENSAEGRRFKLQVKPFQTVRLAVPTWNDAVDNETLVDMEAATLQGYFRQRDLSPDLRAKLVVLQNLHGEVAAAVARRENLEKQLAAIEADQNRIRQNMMALTSASVLRSRYETKLAVQEPQVETLHRQINFAAAHELAVQAKSRTYTLGLTSP